MIPRGPTVHRGHQFKDAPDAELIAMFNKARSQLKLIDSLRRPVNPGNAEAMALRALPPEELARRRAETADLLTDLRAELRRRRGM